MAQTTFHIFKIRFDMIAFFCGAIFNLLIGSADIRVIQFSQIEAIIHVIELKGCPFSVYGRFLANFLRYDFAFTRKPRAVFRSACCFIRDIGISVVYQAFGVCPLIAFLLMIRGEAGLFGFGQVRGNAHACTGLNIAPVADIPLVHAVIPLAGVC